MDRRERGENSIVVGVLSDTHGHLYPRVREILEGVDHIIHAGDVGSQEVLSSLRAIAPVTAVRGNCDLEAWARALPAQDEVELGGVRILVGHIASRLRERLGPEGIDRAADGGRDRSVEREITIVVSGHSHRMKSEDRGGVLHLNPGSAGPERFGLPRTLARLVIIPAKETKDPEQGRPCAQVKVELVVVGEDR